MKYQMIFEQILYDLRKFERDIAIKSCLLHNIVSNFGIKADFEVTSQ